jgi:hypothetical protein
MSAFVTETAEGAKVFLGCSAPSAAMRGGAHLSGAAMGEIVEATKPRLEKHLWTIGSHEQFYTEYFF